MQTQVPSSLTQLTQTPLKESTERGVLTEHAKKFANRLDMLNKSSTCYCTDRACAIRKASRGTTTVKNSSSNEDSDLPFNWDSVESFFKSFTPKFSNWYNNNEPATKEVTAEPIRKQPMKRSLHEVVVPGFPAIKMVTQSSNESNPLLANRSSSSSNGSVKEKRSTPSYGSIKESPNSPNKVSAPKTWADCVKMNVKPVSLPAQTTSLQSQKATIPVSETSTNSHDAFPFLIYPMLDDEQESTPKILAPAAEAMSSWASQV